MSMSHRVAIAPAARDDNKPLFLNDILFILGALLLCVLSAAVQAQAQVVPHVARVLDSQGTTLVERSGQPPRLLGRGETLSERDVVSVARDSWAILEFNDQTRITLRPNTVFRLDAYRDDAPESMLLGLAKGGMRVVTGLLGKRRPDAVRIHTATATIGIRGTEFDARLCADDCATEERARPAPRPVVLPVARVVEMSGVVGAGSAGEPVRLLVPGAMLNEGDAVAVGRGGSALLVFRDGARVALAQNSRFAINRFRFSEAQPHEGSAFLTLYDGNALVSTGQLAKIGPDAFLFRTALGVIRPFGTSFGGGGCIGNFCASGSVTVNQDGASASGSASGGGVSASGTASTGSGGTGATGSVTVGNNTASGSTGTAKLNLPGGQQVLSNAEQFTNEVTDGVRNVITAVVSTVSEQGQNLQNQASNVARGLGDTAAALATFTVEKEANAAQQNLGALKTELEKLNTALRDGLKPEVSRMAPENVASTLSNFRDQTGQAAQQEAARLAAEAKLAAERAGEEAARKAVNGLNSATAPIVRQMTTLLTQLRNNPPRTEAAAQAINSQIQALSNQLNVAIDQATNAAGGIARSDQFLAAAALLRIEGIAFYAAGLQGTQVMTGGTGDGTTGPGSGVSRTSTGPVVAAQLALKQVLASPDMLRGMQLIGLEAEELMVISNEGNGYAIAGMIQSEIGAHLASQGSAAAKGFFAEVNRLAAEAKVAAEAKLAAEKMLAEQKSKAAVAEATRNPDNPGNMQAGERTYDLTDSVVGTFPPGIIVPPGILRTIPGEPKVTKLNDGSFVTEWIERVVPGQRLTGPPTPGSGGGNEVLAGSNVQRRVTTYPDGSTKTELIFSIQFSQPPLGICTVGVCTPGSPGGLLSVRGGGLVFTSTSSPDSQAARANAQSPASLGVFDGEVEVVGRGRVRKGEMLASTGTPVRMTNTPDIPLAKVDLDLFRDTAKTVEQGLYVWVRDGAVRVTKDAESVDVAAGNAAVVTDRVRLLDVVPNFMRFDGTPRPLPSGSGSVIDTFRAGDGAILNMCSIK